MNTSTNIRNKAKRHIGNTFLSLLLVLSIVSVVSPVSAFSDTDSNAVQRMQERGVVRDGELFSPENRCSREQFVVWAVKNIGVKVHGGRSIEPFADIHSAQSFAPFVAKAWRLGALPTAKVFLPHRPITKLDAVTIALLLEDVSLEYEENFTPIDFTDISDASQNLYANRARELRLVFSESADVFGAKSLLTRQECVDILDAIALRRPTERSETYILPESKWDTKPKQEIFDKIWKIIHTTYLRSEEINSDQLMDTVIRNTVDALGDPHTVYFNEAEVAEFLMGVGEGNQYGIGAQIGLDEEGRVQIVKPLRGSPAEQAGLRPGDVILEVDGIDVISAEMTLQEVVHLITGEEGTEVELTLLRRSTVLHTTLIRAEIQRESVSSRIIDGYLVVEVDFFGQETMNDLREVVESNSRALTKGMILDLRNNPGGFLHTAVEMLSEFLPPHSEAVKTRGRDFLHTEFTADNGGEWQNVPLVVLVNERSASASEIVAGGLQDHGRSVVVGGQTYGKGTAQQIVPFSDGSALKVTIAEWVTPLERGIDRIGITPDFVFEDINTDSLAYEYAIRLIQRRQWQ